MPPADLAAALRPQTAALVAAGVPADRLPEIYEAAVDGAEASLLIAGLLEEAEARRAHVAELVGETVAPYLPEHPGLARQLAGAVADHTSDPEEDFDALRAAAAAAAVPGEPGEVDKENWPTWTPAELKQWRARMGWTQKTAADALCMTLPNLKRLEGGGGGIRGAVRKLAEFLEAQRAAPAPVEPLQAPEPDADVALLTAANHFAAQALRCATAAPADRDAECAGVSPAAKALAAAIERGGHSPAVRAAANAVINPANAVLRPLLKKQPAPEPEPEQEPLALDPRNMRAMSVAPTVQRGGEGISVNSVPLVVLNPTRELAAEARRLEAGDAEEE